MTQPQDTKSFAQQEPVLVYHVVAWLVGNLVVFLGGDNTWFGQTVHLNAAASALIPVLSAIVLGASATILRKYVSPAWKVIAKEIQQVSGVDLTGESHVVQLFNSLGLDSLGHPLPQVSSTATTAAIPRVINTVPAAPAPAPTPDSAPPAAAAPDAPADSALTTGSEVTS